MVRFAVSPTRVRVVREREVAYGEAPVPDPFDDAEALQELGDRISTLAAQIHAATERLLRLVAEFDRRRGWQLEGHRSCADWLHCRAGLDIKTAREKVRVAHALQELPLTREAMARGELSFSKVRALTRAGGATPDNEAELIELAKGATTAEVERMVRARRRERREDEDARARRLWESRRLAVFPDEEGMYVVSGRLPAEVGAMLMRAIEAGEDVLWRERWREEDAAKRAAWESEGQEGAAGADRVADGAAGPVGVEGAAGVAQDEAKATREAATRARLAVPLISDAERGRRRADALALVAERALGVGFGVPRACCAGSGQQDKEAGEPGDESGSDAAPPTLQLKPPAPSCGCAPARISGSRADRYQVVVHVDVDTLRSGGKPGLSELADGTGLAPETARRLACDASVVRVLRDGAGSILDVGRKTRQISPALRRALEVRDRGCRFPGCTVTRFTDGHHVAHWADGGETSLENTLLLCGIHHTLVHEGGWGVQWWGRGRPVFFDPRGGMHFDGGWKQPSLAEGAVEALIADNRANGADPDEMTAGARWKSASLIPYEVHMRALEALLPETKGRREPREEGTA